MIGIAKTLLRGTIWFAICKTAKLSLVNKAVNTNFSDFKSAIIFPPITTHSPITNQITNQQRHNYTFIKPVTIKFGRVMTWGESFLSADSQDRLVIWSRELTQQTTDVISTFPLVPRQKICRMITEGEMSLSDKST